jgi:hypothetical protein
VCGRTSGLKNTFQVPHHLVSLGLVHQGDVGECGVLDHLAEVGRVGVAGEVPEGFLCYWRHAMVGHYDHVGLLGEVGLLELVEELPQGLVHQVQLLLQLGGVILWSTLVPHRVHVAVVHEDQAKPGQEVLHPAEEVLLEGVVAVGELVHVRLALLREDPTVEGDVAAAPLIQGRPDPSGQ